MALTAGTRLGPYEIQSAIDVSDIYHALRCLQLTPSQRLAAGLRRGRLRAVCWSGKAFRYRPSIKENAGSAVRAGLYFTRGSSEADIRMAMLK